MKKVFALVLALTMLCCSAAFAADTDIAILVPTPTTAGRAPS